MSVFIGIDIGLEGAMAAVDSRGSCQIADLPVIADGKSNRLDGRGLILLLRQFVPVGVHCVVAFEDVRARPAGNGGSHGNSMHSQGSLMHSRGIVEAVLDIARVERKVVQPQTWKKHFGLIKKSKDDARLKALELYPLQAHELRLKKHHNRGDACLIATFALGKYA